MKSFVCGPQLINLKLSAALNNEIAEIATSMI